MSIAPLEWMYVGAAILLIVLSAIFSASEIGILSVNRFRVHQLAASGSERARLLNRLLDNPSHLFTSVLILITVLNFTNESMVTHWLVGMHGLPEWIPFVSVLLAVLIFSEVTPIAYAAANPELVALRVVPMIAVATTVLRPVVNFVGWIAQGVVRLLGGEARPRPLVTGEEVLTIVDMETERGVLEEEEKDLIHSIFEFTDTVVREIMIPRIDMVALSDDLTIGAAIEVLASEHYSRLPVYQGSPDHVIGILIAKDVLPYLVRHDTDIPVSVAVRPAIFVPETKRVSELLRELRETKQTLAIVLDEYGGTAGMVTIEDLLEEIVGEIYDEYDFEQPPIERLDAVTWLIDGKLPIDEIGEMLGHALPTGDYDTIAGMLYARFGDVPERGEAMEIDGYRFIVDALDSHRITKIRIITPPPVNGASAGAADDHAES